MIAELLNAVSEAATETSEAVASATKATGIALGAGIAALGTLATAIGQGYACAKAVEAVARNPEAESKIRTTLIVGDALAETSAIYSLIIAILLIFVL
jgi:F-type H+-transporting ATPase subunit c